MKLLFLVLIGFNLLQASITRDDSCEVVRDSTTKLEWQDNITSKTTWENSIEYCEQLTLGGHSDWRLPNINELKSIVVRYKSPSIKKGFKNTNLQRYWSSTSGMGYRVEEAWRVDFESGGISTSYKTYDFFYVRCVRAGE